MIDKVLLFVCLIKENIVGHIIFLFAWRNRSGRRRLLTNRWLISKVHETHPTTLKPVEEIKDVHILKGVLNTYVSCVLSVSYSHLSLSLVHIFMIICIIDRIISNSITYLRHVTRAHVFLMFN